MTLLLAGDIGGTKTILRLVDFTADAADNHPRADNIRQADLPARHEAQYPSADYPDLVPMVQQFLQEAAAAGDDPAIARPERACFGIAGPVTDGVCRLTNLSWVLEADRLAAALEIPQVQLINDFAAVGYGVLGLGEDALHVLQAGEPRPRAPIAIIGAGTGLGQGFLIYQGDRYEVYSSEGGHADFAPRSPVEFDLLEYLREKNGLDRVSAERVVSGQGIVAIYNFLRDRGYAKESPALAEARHAWERQVGRSEKTVDPGAAIAQGADAGDPLCDRALQMFVSLYGAEAGNLALKLLPYGGLYIAGGIAGKNLQRMTDGEFLRNFSRKGRMTPLLQAVPVYVVADPQVGLVGAALCAARG